MELKVTWEILVSMSLAGLQGKPEDLVELPQAKSV